MSLNYKTFFYLSVISIECTICHCYINIFIHKHIYERIHILSIVTNMYGCII
jgi:hypothetical protein